MPVLLGYIHISYGPRPGTDLVDCEAAARQLRILLRVAEAASASLRTCHDYRREVNGLKDLPVLKNTLAEMLAAGRGTLSVPCLGELLQAPAIHHRKKFLAELKEYDEQLYDLAGKKLMCDLNADELTAMMFLRKPLARVTPPKSRTVEEHRKSARNASSAAKIAKSSRSAQTGAQLAAIKAELGAQGLRATLKEIAGEANRRGLRTQSGSEWAEATVSYQLKKLAEASE